MASNETYERARSSGQVADNNALHLRYALHGHVCIAEVVHSDCKRYQIKDRANGSVRAAVVLLEQPHWTIRSLSNLIGCGHPNPQYMGTRLQLHSSRWAAQVSQIARTAEQDPAGLLLPTSGHCRRIANTAFPAAATTKVVPQLLTMLFHNCWEYYIYIMFVHSLWRISAVFFFFYSSLSYCSSFAMVDTKEVCRSIEQNASASFVVSTIFSPISFTPPPI